MFRARTVACLRCVDGAGMHPLVDVLHEVCHSCQVTHVKRCVTLMSGWIAMKLAYSKGDVDRAGETARRLLSEPLTSAAVDELADAVKVIVHFRACHQQPLSTCTVGLRSSVSTELWAGAPLNVSQRLKRFPTIIDKLMREPSLKLARMQDIGGCRAVLPDTRAIRRVEAQAAEASRVSPDEGLRR